MTLLTLRALGHTLAEPLFADLSLTLSRGDRLGLVAANGRGKSTLLRFLAGQGEPTTGEITRARGLRVALAEQEAPEALRDQPVRDAVLGALDPATAETEYWRADIVLDDLEIPPDLRDRPLGALSGGWRRLALLARAAITEPNVLLLDEPTNHLDLTRILKLERWLADLPRDTGLIVASHDRAFLDAVTTRTLFLRTESSRLFALPYSRARAALDEADAADERRFAGEMKQADQLRRQAAKLKNIGINSGSDLLIDKTKQLKDRADRIEAAARPAHKDRSAGAIRLAGSGSHAKALVTLDDADVTAPDGRLLFRTGRLWLSPGDRVVLLGANGAGKSRLMGMVIAALDGRPGPVRVASSAVPGVADQALSHLDGDRTPLDAICRRFDVGDQRARALLAGAGMDMARQAMPVAGLSGGQRARLAMLILRLERPNLYLLDEPTNHLDIEGQEALERELQDEEAGCLLVSHDRRFVTNVGNRFWQITGRRLVEIEGPQAFFASMKA